MTTQVKLHWSYNFIASKTALNLDPAASRIFNPTPIF
jgi:hypothetical protein